jgi:hypothetical protein
MGGNFGGNSWRTSANDHRRFCIFCPFLMNFAFAPAFANEYSVASLPTHGSSVILPVHGPYAADIVPRPRLMRFRSMSHAARQ